ncbi:MAG: phosphatase PAP2 family protein [Actinobacteria bacterium]|nr:phosphatase PAP2 family protein [Actinomycetota bacterium]
MVLAISGLAWLTMDILHGGPIARFDHAVADWAWSTHIRRGNLPRKVAVYALTRPGDRMTVAGVILPFVCWLSWRHRSLQPLLRMAVAVSLLVGTVVGYKAVVGRTGPLVDRVLVGGQSFPSGHVATAVVGWGLVAWLAADFGLPVWFRRASVVAVYVAPVVTATGMLLLDYHWLADLVAGAALGTLLLRVVHAIFAGRLGDWGHAGLPGVARAGSDADAVLAGARVRG